MTSAATSPVTTWRSGEGMSNITAVRGEGGVIVIDAGPSPSAARRFVAETATGRVDTCVLTHHHADHVLGISGLDARAVLATEAAATLIAERGDAERAGFARMLTAHHDEIAAAPLPVVTRTLPADEITSIGDGAVRLMPMGHAHTPGDLIAHHVESGTVVTGDLVFAGIVPVLRDADIDGWIAALERLDRLAPSTVIPGHGSPGTRAALADALDLLTAMRALVAERVADGTGVDSIAIPPRFSTLARQDRVAPALAAIHARLSERDTTTAEEEGAPS